MSILPESQWRLRRELGTTLEHFTLYGRTAIARRLGHRQSVDFDIFSNRPFYPNDLDRGRGPV